MSKKQMAPDGELTLIQSNALDVYEARMGNIAETCRAVGIARETFYRWQRESEVFMRRATEVREGLIDRTESKLHEAIGNNSVQAIMFHLKTKGRNRGYVERMAQEDNSDTEEEQMAARMNSARKRVVEQYKSGE